MDTDITSAEPLSDEGAPPAPAPLPIPVTSVRPALGISRGALAAMVAAVVMCLFACGAAGVWLAMTAGRISQGLATRPLRPARSSASSPAPSLTQDELERQAVIDFPELVLARPQPWQPEDSTMRVVTLTSERHPAITIEVVYDVNSGAPRLADGNGALARGSRFAGFADGLLDQVSAAHPDAKQMTIQSVLADDTETTGTVRFDVGFSNVGAELPDGQAADAFELTEATGAWRRLAGVRDANAGPDGADPAGSEKAARAFATRMFPGYRITGVLKRDVYGDGNPTYYVALESKWLKGFRWILDPDSVMNDPGPYGVGAFLAPPNGARAEPFAKAWAAGHPGTVVWDVTANAFDDVTVANQVTVSYFSAPEEAITPGLAPRKVDYVYDPKHKAWSPAK